MKKLLCLTALLLALAFALGACGEGSEYRYTYAWIALEGETVAEGYVSQWITYNNGTVRLTIDGRRYLTSCENVVIVDMPEKFEKEAEARPC